MRETAEILLLILVANGAPILLSFIFSHRMALPVDLGFKLGDQQALFGKTKTWRGLIASLVFTILASVIIGLGIWTGFIISVLAMTGDLLSSFIKRRLKKPPSSQVFLLDQVPESLFPVFGVVSLYSLQLMQVIVIVVSFIIMEVVLSLILYRIGVRKRPY